MKFVFIYDNYYGVGIEWERCDLKEWLIDVFEVFVVIIVLYCIFEICKYVEGEFLSEGWVLNVDFD